MSNNTLFYAVKRVETFLNDGNQLLRNLSMNSPDLVIWKNVLNTVEFMVKNLDRKPIPLRGVDVRLSVVDTRTSSILLNKKLIITDEANARAVLQLQPWETNDWNLGFLQYSIVVIDERGEHLLMLDRDQGTVGVLELKQAATLPQWRPSIVMNTFTPTNKNGKTRWVSSAVAGSIQVNNNTNLHTVAVYMQNFSGNLYLEGRIGKSLPEEIDWFPVQVGLNGPSIVYKTFNGIDTFNVQTPLEWLRFSFEPANADSKITQILLRN